MTYGQVKEIIRNVCSMYTFDEIRKANKELKKLIGDVIVNMWKTEDALTTIEWYEIALSADHEDTVMVGYDFWNGRIVEEERV